MVTLGTILTVVFLLIPGTAFHLAETKRVSLPLGVQLSHAVLTPVDEVLVIDNRRHAVWISKGSKWSSFRLPNGFIPVGASALGGKISVIDATGSVASISPSGTNSDGWVLSPPTIPNDRIEGVQSAVGADEGWIAVGPCSDSPTDSCVVRQTADQRTTVLGRFQTQVTERGPDRLWLAVAAGKLILSQASFPFSKWELDLKTGTFGALGNGGGIESFKECPDRDWIGLTVLPLDRGSIQSHVDLGSDHRCITRFDGIGRKENAVLLDNPLTLLDSRPGDRTLLGSQRLNQIDLVFYRWDWR